jgi:hypothetical protein
MWHDMPKYIWVSFFVILNLVNPRFLLNSERRHVIRVSPKEKFINFQLDCNWRVDNNLVTKSNLAFTNSWLFLVHLFGEKFKRKLDNIKRELRVAKLIWLGFKLRVEELLFSRKGTCFAPTSIKLGTKSYNRYTVLRAKLKKLLLNARSKRVLDYARFIDERCWHSVRTKFFFYEQNFMNCY